MAFAQSEARNGYVALDIETSGLDPDTDEIIELALVQVNSEGRAALILHHRIRPSKSLSSAAERIVGFTNASLADAPSFHEIASELEEAIAGKTIVSINASFDRFFLEAALKGAGCNGLQNVAFTDLTAHLPSEMRRKGFDEIRAWAGDINEALPLSLGLVTRVLAKLVSEGESMEEEASEKCCDVCGRDRPSKVAASTLGPVSLAYCNECVARSAEPLMMVATAIFTAGGPQESNLSELREVFTFDEGQYHSLDYVIKLYPDLESSVKEAFFGD